MDRVATLDGEVSLRLVAKLAACFIIGGGVADIFSCTGDEGRDVVWGNWFFDPGTYDPGFPNDQFA